MNDVRKLIVVYKDGAVAEMLKRNMELTDDTNNGGVIGIEDGSVEVILWDEKTWDERKKNAIRADRILFLGSGKEADVLIPLVDMKFQRYGIRYGWTGKVGVLVADDSQVKDKVRYQDFREAYDDAFCEQDAIPQKEVSPTMKGLATAGTIGAAILTGGLSLAAIPVVDGIQNQQQLVQQLYFYGVRHFYLNYMDEFING